jgi:hypothetical protein
MAILSFGPGGAMDFYEIIKGIESGWNRRLIDRDV